MRASMCLEHGGPDRTPCVRSCASKPVSISETTPLLPMVQGFRGDNLIAPTMMQVLQYIAQHDNELNFISDAAAGGL